MTNQKNAPSADVWRSLYAAADSFWRASPWKILNNGMLFGVEDPLSKQIGWCSIMGDGGLVYGLSVMRGPRGFKAFIGMLNDTDHDDLLPYLDSLNLTFEHSDFLESRDLSVIKELGIGSLYKGTQKWPIFRAYVPERRPWYLTSDEADFLKCSMEQALEVARSAAIDRMVIVKGAPDKFLIRVPIETAGLIEWRSEYRAAELYVEPCHADMEIDPSTAGTIRNLPINKELLIEADLFLSLTPICDSEPPWIPWMILVIDVNQDRLLRTETMAMPKDSDHIFEGSRLLITLLKGLDHRPREIRVKNALWHRHLEKPCAKLGIQLKKATSLPAIKKAKDSFKEFMRWDKSLLD